MTGVKIFCKWLQNFLVYLKRAKDIREHVDEMSSEEIDKRLLQKVLQLQKHFI